MSMVRHDVTEFLSMWQLTNSSQGYGIATPKGSRWRDRISQAILYLQEKSAIQVPTKDVVKSMMFWWRTVLVWNVNPNEIYIPTSRPLLIPGKKNILQNQLFKSEYLKEFNELSGLRNGLYFTQMLYNQWWDKNGKDKTKVKQQVS